MASNKLEKRPKLSIVIPNFQQGRFLGSAINSLTTQENITLKIAVMDAGSTDESIDVINQYRSKIDFWRSNADDGQSAAINEGIKSLGDADYVGWLNADDTVLPNGLTKMADFLEQNPECVAVFGKAYITDVSGNKTGEYPTEEFNRKRFARICTICQPASLIRKSAWDAIGGVNESLQMCMDYHLWWKLSELGQLGFLQDYIACSRDHEETKTRNYGNQYFQEAIKIIRSHYKYVPLHWYLSKAAYLKLSSKQDYDLVDKISVRLYAGYWFFRDTIKQL